MKLKVTAIGNSAGVVLPKEVLHRLHVNQGDTLHVIETPNGVELTPYDPQFAAQVEAAEIVMHKNRDALRKLAK
jgi:putative addiction module antidote